MHGSFLTFFKLSTVHFLSTTTQIKSCQNAIWTKNSNFSDLFQSRKCLILGFLCFQTIFFKELKLLTKSQFWHFFMYIKIADKLAFSHILKQLKKVILHPNEAYRQLFQTKKGPKKLNLGSNQLYLGLSLCNYYGKNLKMHSAQLKKGPLYDFSEARLELSGQF